MIVPLRSRAHVLTRDPPWVLTPSGPPTHASFWPFECRRAGQANGEPCHSRWRLCSSKGHEAYEPPTSSAATINLVMQRTASIRTTEGNCRYCGRYQSDLLTHLRQAFAEERLLFLAKPRADSPRLPSHNKMWEGGVEA
jgi:hypothetical protein